MPIFSRQQIEQYLANRGESPNTSVGSQLWPKLNEITNLAQQGKFYDLAEVYNYAQNPTFYQNRQSQYDVNKNNLLNQIDWTYNNVLKGTPITKDTVLQNMGLNSIQGLSPEEQNRMVDEVMTAYNSKYGNTGVPTRDTSHDYGGTAGFTTDNPGVPPINPEQVFNSATPEQSTGVANNTTANIPNGSIVKFDNSPEVYLVDNGQLRHFTKEVKDKSGRSIFASMETIPSSYKTNFTIGSDINSDIPFDPTTKGWGNKLTTGSTIFTTNANSTLKSSTPTATNTIKGYDVNNNNAVVYVPAGVYVPGVSSTLPTTSSAPTSSTPITPSTEIPNNSSPISTQQATLYGPDGKMEKVDVGSPRASELQSQGWGLTTGSYKAPDNTPTNNQTFSASSIDNTKPYGTERLSADVETWTGQFIGTILTTLKKSGGVTETAYNKIVNDPTIISKYIKALLYGGYTMDDVYRDIKIQDLSSQGNNSYSNLKGIDDNIKADAFYNSDTGKQVKADTLLAPSMGLSGMDASLFNNPIFKIPGQAFSTIVKPIDWTSPEFKAEAEKIQASYYDILNQNYEAQTDQQKAVAKNNWETFKTNLQEKYNISLGNNVRNAWNQLEQLFSSTNEAGTLQSGLVNEATDKYLSDVRRSQDVTRQDTTDQKNLEERNYLLQNGTPEEISNYVNRVGKDVARQQGFIPSTETLSFYNKDNLKAQYPDMTDAEINNVIGMMVDANGNYNSKLYQTLSANKYDIGQQKTTYQQGKLYEQKLAEENKAYAPFTSSNPLSSYQPEYKDAANAAGTLSSPYSNPTNPINPIIKLPTTPYVGSDSSKWSMNQPAVWTAPTGYEKIANPSAQINYTDIMFGPNGTDKYGKKKIV